MILLNPKQSLEIITTSTARIDYNITITNFDAQGNSTKIESIEGSITSVGSTLITNNNTTIQQISLISIRNSSGTTSNTLTISRVVNGVSYPITPSVTYLLGEFGEYDTSTGWKFYDAQGLQKFVGAQGPTGSATINAGGTPYLLGDLYFVNSNSISWGISSNSITASFSNAGGGGAMSISAGTLSGTRDNLVFSNSNGVSFGMSGSTITASHNGLTSQSNQAFSAQGGSSAFQTLVFSNSNNFSFINNGGSIVGSYTVPSTTGLISAINLSAGTSSQNLTKVDFDNSNGITFGLSNGTITASHNGLTSQSVQTQNLVSLNGSTGSLVLSNSNGVTFGGNASTITASFSTLVYSNMNGVTFGVNAGTLSASVQTNYQSTGNYLTTAMQSNAGSNFVNTSAGLNLTNVSATFGSNSISLSVGNQSAQPVAASASNGSFNFSTLKFVETNGVTWATSTDGIRASVQTNYQSTGNYLTTAMQSNASSLFAATGFTTTSTNGSVILGTHDTNGLKLAVPPFITTANAQTQQPMYFSVSNSNTSANTIVFGNLNGVSWSFSNGSIVGSVQTNYQSTGNYLTTAMASNAGSNFVGTNSALTGNGVSATINSSGISLNVPAFLTTAQPVGAYLTTAMLSNANTSFVGLNSALTANGVSASINSSGISLNFPAFLTTAQPVGAYLTTAAQSNQVINSLNGSTGQISLNIGSSLSASTNGSSITFGLASNITTALQSTGNYLTTAMASNAVTLSNIQITAGTANNLLSNFSFANDGGVSFGLNGSTITASAPSGGGASIKVSAGSTSNLMSAVTFGNGNNVSFGLAGSVVTASIANQFTQSRLFVMPWGQISSSQQSNASMSFKYISLESPLAFSRVDIPINLSIGSSATANTANIVFTSGMGIYSLNGSTLSPIVAHTNSTTYTWASNSANYSSLLGGRYASFPLATTLSAGEYWVGAFLSTNNNSSIGTATTAIANTISVFIGSSLTAQNFADFGATTGASSNGLIPFQGLVSLSISNTTQTFQQSQFTVSGAQGGRANIMLVFRNI